MTDVEYKPPLCVYCSAPWTSDMMHVYSEADEEFGYYPGEHCINGIDSTIEVTCSTCGRLVYKKEVRISGRSGWSE